MAQCILLLIAALAFFRTSVTAQDFLPHPFSDKHSGVLLGDLNGDGRYDLLTTESLRLYMNDGAFSFTNRFIGSFPNPNGARAILADLDNDNDLDIFYSSSDYRLLFVLRNDGGEQMVRIDLSFPPFGFGDVKAMDLDRDGDLDLLLTGISEQIPPSPVRKGQTMILRNDGNFSFTAIYQRAPDLTESAISLADFNGDGFTDLFGAGNDSQYRPAGHLYYGGENFQFSLSRSNLLGVVWPSIATGDHDNDGDWDLLVAGHLNRFPPAGEIGMYINTDGLLNLAPAALIGSFLSGWFDYDADGDLDVLSGGRSETAVFQNDGLGTYTKNPSVWPPVPIGGSVAFGDLNGDSTIDVVLENDRTITVHENTLPGTNTPPSVPSALDAEPAPKQVVLSWAAATDAEQAGGLTYNVRIGRTPGGTEIVSPMANLVSGKLLAPFPGNAGLRTRMELSLPPGTYYWSVQAVDHSYDASSFAPEQFLLVPHRAPLVETLAANDLSPTRAELQGHLNTGGAATTAWFEYGPISELTNRTPAFEISGASPDRILVSDIVIDLAARTTNYFRLVASNQFGITLANTMYLVTPVYAAYSFHQTGSPGLLFSRTHVADLDADGRMDYLHSGRRIDAIEYVTWYFRNQGDLQFDRETLALGGLHPGVLEFADPDLDGDLDIAFAGNHNGTAQVKVFINDGRGLMGGSPLSLFEAAVPWEGIPSLNWLDFDNDGDEDLLLAGHTGGPIITLFENRHGELLPLQTEFPALLSPRGIAGDFNSDGSVDLILAGMTAEGGRLLLLSNRGNGTFLTTDSAAIPNYDTVHLLWGDFDQDGMGELILNTDIQLGIPGTARYLIAEERLAAPTALPGEIANLYAHGDHNLDGFPDLLVAQFSSVKVLDGAGTGQFVGSGFNFNNSLNGRFADFDDDGRIDILVSRLFSGELHKYDSGVFRSNLAGTNTPPSAPLDLQSSFTGNAVQLSWQASTDPEQSGGLTYNVWVKNSTGKLIVSPLLDRAGTKLLLLRNGNAGLLTEKILENLSAGSYTWGVQAVDSGYNLSPPGTTGAFMIDAPAQLRLAADPEGRISVHSPNAGQIVLQTSSDLNSWISSQTNDVSGGQAVFEVQMDTGESTYYRALQY